VDKGSVHDGQNRCSPSPEYAQANMVKLKTLWKDDLPIDDEIYFKEADNYGKQWTNYSKIKLSLERNANKRNNV
jgi:hypothetical protein